MREPQAHVASSVFAMPTPATRPSALPSPVLPPTSAPTTARAVPQPPPSSPRPIQHWPHEDGASEHGTDGALALKEPVRESFVPPPAVESEALVTWRALVGHIRASQPAVASTLELAAPLTVTRERIVLGFEPESFEIARKEDTAAARVLEEAARAYFGTDTVVSLEVTARGSKGASIASIDAAKKRQALVEARAAVEKHPLVQKVIAIFDAELKDIKLPPQED